MVFSIDAQIFERFRGLRVAVAVGRGLDQRTAAGEVGSLLRDAWARSGEESARHPNPQSHPHIKAWREAMRAMGVHHRDFPSSIESLVRRSWKSDTPFSVNPLVDFYNAVSLRHYVPAGGFDLAALGSDLELRLTRGGDTFLALDSGEPVGVAEGEVAYATGMTVLTRHFVWRQSRDALIGADTEDVLLLAELLGEVDHGVAEAVERDLREGLAGPFRSERVDGFILSAEDPRIEV